MVIDISNDRYLVRDKTNKYYIYSKVSYNVGDVFYIEGKLEPIKTPSYDGDYNNKLNLFSRYISGYINVSDIKYKTNRFTLYKIRYNILNYYKNKIDSNSYKYFEALTLAKNELDKDSFIKLNLAHIIAISGFHIVLIYTFIRRYLFRLTHNLYLSDNIAIIVVLIYNILTGFSISVLKATIYLLLKKYNEKYDYFTSLDILSLTFIVMMLRPRLIFNIGFILGFLSSFILLFSHEMISDKGFIKNIKQGVLITLVLLPFISKMNNELSILSIFSFLFFDIFSYFIIPYSFILFIIPSISKFVEPAIIFINNTLTLTSSMMVVYFPTMKDVIIYIYYIVLYIFLIYHKKILKVLLTIILFILVYSTSLFAINRVEFIDVNQGDSTLISYGGENILIDTHNCYKFLLKEGIYNIKYIFITHDDLDHLSDLAVILDNLNVSCVFTNKYSKVVLEICAKNNIDCKLVGKGDTIKTKGGLFTVLGPSYDHKDDNLNSLVIKYSTNYYNYLFTGDMAIENEIELMNTDIGVIDILKVAHHGSNTSSHIEFLKYIKPKVSIISVGNNKYGLPSKEVVDNLNKISILYITKVNGNIRVYNDKIIPYK